MQSAKNIPMTMDSVRNVVDISRQTIMNLQAIMKLGNGGQMFWFAALVNGDSRHTLIQKRSQMHMECWCLTFRPSPVDEN